MSWEAHEFVTDMYIERNTGIVRGYLKANNKLFVWHSYGVHVYALDDEGYVAVPRYQDIDLNTYLVAVYDCNSIDELCKIVYWYE